VASHRSDIWLYLIVTAVTLLIWFWAAGETLEQDSISTTVQFAAVDPERSMVMPNTLTATLTLEGSRVALREAGQTLRMPLVLELGREGVPAEPGGHVIDLLAVVAQHDRLRAAKLHVIACQPAAVPIEVDEIVRRSAPVQAAFPPGVRLEGEIEITPAEAQLVLPSCFLPSDPAALAIEAALDLRQLERIEPGRRQTLEVKLRPKGMLAANQAVHVQPPNATVSFTVQSKTRQITLPTVRVQLRSAPENLEEYAVQIREADKVLRDVAVTADSDLIRRIESGEVKVFAVVYLATTDFDQRIQSKTVTCFATDGGTTVEAVVGDAAQPPAIGLTITERGATP